MSVRFNKELEILSKNNYSFTVIDTDIINVRIKIHNKSSLYYKNNSDKYDYTLQFKLRYGNGEYNYPINSPKVKFLDTMFHPNVLYKNGDICLDTLSENWSPVFTLFSVCNSIILLLDNPNCNSPLNREAVEYMNKYKSDRLKRKIQEKCIKFNDGYNSDSSDGDYSSYNSDDSYYSS